MLYYIHRKLLIPAFEAGIKGRKTFRYWRDLEQSQWLPRGELESLQFDALRRLIAYAFANCPYYRREWTRLNIGPHQMQSIEDFRSWPVIGREVIRENRPGMRAQLPGLHLLTKSTGGSTGVPLHFDLDTENLDHRMAAWHRGYDWAGAGPGTKQFYLWGVPLGEQTLWNRWKDALYDRLYRRMRVNSFELSNETLPRILERLNRRRPEVIVAYTNPLFIFARWLDETGLKPFSPRSIVVGAEKLHDFQRELIQRVFDAPVFETYGTREFMLIGSECDQHEGLHLSMENLLVEVLDDDGCPTANNEEGNIVVTDLTNYGMPFVRYANGDRAVAGWRTCTCGRGLPLMQKIVGRQLDMLQTPDGRRIPGEFFPHLMKDFPAVRRFQVVQEGPDRIQLRVVLKGQLSEDERRTIDHEVAKVLGSATFFELLPVDEIAPSSLGNIKLL